MKKSCGDVSSFINSKGRIIRGGGEGCLGLIKVGKGLGREGFFG